MALTVTLLADSPSSVPAVAEMRWQEWGHPPESEDPAWWLDTTIREAGRIPVQRDSFYNVVRRFD